eukprot:s2929_g5.t1
MASLQTSKTGKSWTFEEACTAAGLEVSVTRWWHRRRSRRKADPLESWLRKVLLRGVGPGCSQLMCWGVPQHVLTSGGHLGQYLSEDPELARRFAELRATEQASFMNYLVSKINECFDIRYHSSLYQSGLVLAPRAMSATPGPAPPAPAQHLAPSQHLAPAVPEPLEEAATPASSRSSRSGMGKKRAPLKYWRLDQYFMNLYIKQDLPANVPVLAEGPGRLQWAESVNDIVCCVKRWAADQQLSQDTTKTVVKLTDAVKTLAADGPGRLMFSSGLATGDGQLQLRSLVLDALLSLQSEVVQAFKEKSASHVQLVWACEKEVGCQKDDTEVMLLENVPEYGVKEQVKEHMGPHWDAECAQERTLKEYHDKNLVTKKWSIADLTQLPRNGRGRTETDQPLKTPFEVLLTAFTFKAPWDGLPCLKDWGTHATNIWSQGYESWRENIEIRPVGAELLGQPMDFGTIEACKGSGRMSILLFTVLYNFLEMKRKMTQEELAGFTKNLG